MILVARHRSDERWDVEAATFVAEEIYPWVFLEGDGTLNAYMDDSTGPTHWAPKPSPPSAWPPPPAIDEGEET